MWEMELGEGQRKTQQWGYVWEKYGIDTILVGGLEHFLFSIIYGIILPID